MLILTSIPINADNNPPQLSNKDIPIGRGNSFNAQSQNVFFIVLKPIPKIYLNNQRVSPNYGYNDTEFNFSVVYKNTDGIEPNQVIVLIDGFPYNVTKGEGNNFTSGVLYYCKKNLSEGIGHWKYYSYFFYANFTYEELGRNKTIFAFSPLSSGPTVIRRNLPLVVTNLTPIEENITIYETEPITFNISVLDLYSPPGNDRLVYKWYVNGDFITYRRNFTFYTNYDTSLGTYPFDWAYSSGNYVIKVNVSEANTNESYSVEWEWNLSVKNRNRMPIPNIESPIDRHEYLGSEYISFNASGSYDLDGDNLTYTWVVHWNNNWLSWGIIGTEKVFEKKLYKVGNHIIILSVNDSSTSSYSTIHIKILDSDNDGVGDYEEVFIYGTNATNPDTDGDGLNDKEEINGVKRYVVDKGDKGYLFHINNPGSYSKIFTYKTNASDIDTDDDGISDYYDLVPLDFDMDGNGYINSGNFAYSNNIPYFNRLYEAIKNYPDYYLLILTTNGDIDGDGKFGNDGDDDNDGMSDEYEWTYGMTYQNNYAGWQHPLIYNVKYGLFIVGGSTDQDQNYPAFWNDARSMYIVLRDKYKWNVENMFVHRWDKNKGTYDNIYVNGPADWIVNNSRDYWGDGIYQTITEKLKNMITKNDFLFIMITAHGVGGKDKGPGAGEFILIDVNVDPKVKDFCGWKILNNSLLKLLHYNRNAIVISMCASGTAIKGTDTDPNKNLKDPNRIIITSCDKNEASSVWDNKNHYIFHYYRWGVVHEYEDGFVYKYENTDIISLKESYDSGVNAVENSPANNDQQPQLYEGGVYADKTYL